jgi:hypothetical protein
MDSWRSRAFSAARSLGYAILGFVRLSTAVPLLMMVMFLVAAAGVLGGRDIFRSSQPQVLSLQERVMGAIGYFMLSAIFLAAADFLRRWTR